VARRASGLVVVPPALTCNAASAPSGGNPPGETAKRRLPLLQLLAVAPPRRVAAPRQTTLGDLSHSQIKCEQALVVPPLLDTVVRVSGGAPCFKNEYKARFFNQRACAMVCLRDAVRQGRIVIRTDDMTVKLREKIIDQATRLPYHFSEGGGLRYVIMSKEGLRKKGIKSPDLIGAISFVFLESCTYAPAEQQTGGESGGIVASALEKAAATFADV